MKYKKMNFKGTEANPGIYFKYMQKSILLIPIYVDLLNLQNKKELQILKNELSHLFRMKLNISSACESPEIKK